MPDAFEITKDTSPEGAWEHLRDTYGWEETSTAVFQLNRFGTVSGGVPQGLVLHLEDFGLDRLDELEELA